MKLKVKASKNILLVGDLKIRVLSGRAEIFGWEVPRGEDIVIERLMSAPLVAIDDVELEVEFGDEGYIAETPVELIPKSWVEAVKSILSEQTSEPKVIFVVANVDSGKSGFVCYFINKALARGKKVVVVNTDTGQSEMNPPTTIGYAVADEHIYHLSQLSYDVAFFIGSTSPAGLFDRVIAGLLKLIEKALSEKPDYVIINTTGWVHTVGGRELKEIKILAVKPDYVVIIEKEKDELSYIRAILESLGRRYILLESAPRLRTRSREERRQLRKIYYQREFNGAKDEIFLMDDYAFMYSFLGSGAEPSAEEILRVIGILGFKPEYIEKTPDYMIIVTSKQISEDLIISLQGELGRPVKVLMPSDLENLIVGLQNDEGFLEALGIIRKFDPETKVLTIFTRADPKKVRIIALGRIKLNEDLDEVGWIEPWSI